MVTVFRGQPQCDLAVQSCPPGGGGAAEVDLAVPLVGGFAGQQACGQRDHLPDVGVRPGLQGRLPDAERGHVLVEVELLDDGELVVGEPARPAAASRTSSTSVTLRHTITSVPSACSTRASVSTHTNVAAWPRWVTS